MRSTADRGASEVVAVALLTGLLAVPYPLLVARGTATSEVLARR